MPDPVRLLFFTTVLGGGGAESHALRLMNHLDRDQFRIDLAVTRKGGSYEKFLRDDVTVRDVSWPWIPSSSGRVAASAVGLARLLREQSWDVVLSVMDFPNLAALGAQALLGPRAPRLVLVVQIPPGIHYARTAAGRLLIHPAIRALYPRADRVIALSQGVRGDLEALAPNLEGRIDVIHNAVIDPSFLDGVDRPTPGFPSDGSPVIVACGRLIAQKDYPTLLAAFRRVADARPAHLVILGEGPDQQALEQRIATLRLSERVHLLGFQDYPAAYMKRADVFVLSSIYEGFGNVIVEAMACGTPVVSTDCPHGPNEILEDGVTGRLVPMQDPVALSDAILAVLADEAATARMVDAALRRSAAFSGATIARRYESVILDVVSSGGAARGSAAARG